MHGEENALVNPTVDDIPDYEVRTAITQVLYNYLYYQSIIISFYTRPFNLHWLFSVYFLIALVQYI